MRSASAAPRAASRLQRPEANRARPCARFWGRPAGVDRHPGQPRAEAHEYLRAVGAGGHPDLHCPGQDSRRAHGGAEGWERAWDPGGGRCRRTRSGNEGPVQDPAGGWRCRVQRAWKGRGAEDGRQEASDPCSGFGPYSKGSSGLRDRDSHRRDHSGRRGDEWMAEKRRARPGSHPEHSRGSRREARQDLRPAPPKGKGPEHRSSWEEAP